MRRDFDLIRQILLEVEGSPTPHFDGIVRIEGYENQVVQHHVSLLVDAGFIPAIELHDQSSPEGYWLQDPQLTCDGHEFLNSIKDPTTWEKTKSGLKQVGNWSLPVITKVAASVVLQQLKEAKFLPD
ncbi:MAG: DUF2513 domain-containing protein [Pseudomonadota bacterium]